jgi:hypothetical protein
VHLQGAVLHPVSEMASFQCMLYICELDTMRGMVSETLFTSGDCSGFISRRRLYTGS